MVIQKMRQLRMQHAATSRTNRSAARCFDETARLQYLVEGLDLPAQRIPTQFLNRFSCAAERQIRQQSPVDPVSVFWCALFLGVDNRRLDR